MSITGERDDRPGGGPQKVGIAAADVFTGMYSSVAILAALNHRAVSGEGQYIDMALLDCIIAVGGNQGVGYLTTGEAPGRYGNEHASLVPYQVFSTADSEIVVAVGNDSQWARFCDTIGRNDLASDERYRVVAGRVNNRSTLIPELCTTMLERPTAEWVQMLEAVGVPCGPINNYQQVFELPQVKHRGLRVDVPTASGGAVPLIASPLRLTGTPVEYVQAPPTLGEHTDAVLADMLGKAPEQIAALREQRII